MIPMLERAGTLETLETVATLDKLKLNSDRSKFKFLGTEKVSFTNISKQVASQVESYHQRQLSDKFFCVYLDATYIPLRRDTYQREAVYVAVGIKPNGHKEIIDYRIAPVENIEIWGEMISNFKERGLEQVELFLSDGFVGIKDMLKQYYPKSKFQRCLVHVMRNIKGKVRVSDRKEALDDFKQVSKFISNLA